jgi:hypothetical protein
VSVATGVGEFIGLVGLDTGVKTVGDMEGVEVIDGNVGVARFSAGTGVDSSGVPLRIKLNPNIPNSMIANRRKNPPR